MNPAHLVAVITILMWSSLAVLTVSVKHISPLLSVGLVLIVASLPGLRYWRQWNMPIKYWIFSITGMFGYHYLLFDAFAKAPAINVNLIQYLWPLFIVLGSPLVTRLPLNWGHILGGILGFGGIAIALSPSEGSFSGKYLLGYTEALLAALLWTFYTLSNKKNKHMSISTVAGICFISGVLSVVCYFLVMPSSQGVTLDGKDVLSIIALGLGPMGLAFYTWDYAVRHGDPRFIGTLCYFTPLISTLLMVFVYQDIELEMVHLIALAFVSIGALLGRIVKDRPSRRAQISKQYLQ
ncbi:DMT family transporter [Vibrio hangzhouensis]|uniref:Permease of the drug/metabolite transporter (DMT) superfamily n=1 Tax=Vibrio hangzhouensis TaxID=462991 RepID=A0A1H5RRW8_9VIBR|nr:DMT family transporter [Vibrio hangzhouensis]SEF40874.1 Permease of the drug/metabolite transporter (DMT) superfamily [Vibrio hangzhouensis]